ncbi:MAG: TSUP family transporter [Candidatus Puniceispirillaceae bacterium]
MSGADDLWLLAAGIYLIAGTIKGLLGLGLPTTAITLLTLFVSPFQALALNLVPMLFVNIWQFARADNPISLTRIYAPFALSLSVTIFAFSYVTASLSLSSLQLFVALTVILFALFNLFQRPFALSAKHDTRWQLCFGAMAGIMGALTSMWAVPLVMYLLSRNLSKKEFVDASGFLLLVGSVPLGFGYIATGIVTTKIILPAIAAVMAALIGFSIGEFLRGKIAEVLFRKILLWFFLAIGLRMVFVVWQGA